MVIIFSIKFVNRKKYKKKVLFVKFSDLAHETFYHEFALY